MELHPRTRIAAADHPPRRSRRRGVLVALALVAALLAGCSDDEVREGAATGTPPHLDLDSLEAEVPGGTLRAQARAEAFVGAVTDEVFVGVAFPEGVGPDAQVTVYLCDDEHGEWFGEQLERGSVRIQGEQLTVVIELDGDEVSGSLTWRGEELGDFDTTRATGQAGLYAAGATFDDVDHSAAWVVLPDGRQRGYMGTCPPMPLHVCWLQQR